MPEDRGQLTVLGASPSWQNAGEACSCYLVDGPGTRLMIDCGNGAFGELRRHHDYASVDAIAISHTHGDHMLDLLPMAYALLYSPRAVAGELRKPRLLLPPGATERLRGIFGLIDRAELLELAYDPVEYREGEPVELPGLRVDFAEVPHYVPTHAIGVETPGGGRLVFGADHRPSERVVEFARGADVLLTEATLPAPEGGERGHSTAEEAAIMAREAEVDRLVLTHMTDELPREELLAAAQAIHPATTLAHPGATYPL